MKNLTECLKEAIEATESSVLNEASGLLVMAYDHDYPEDTFIISNCTSEDIKKLKKETALQYDTAKYKGGYVMIYHDDEDGYITNIKFNSESEMKAYAEKTLKNWDFDGEENVDFDKLGLNLANEKWDNNYKGVWKDITNYIKITAIDGDSSSAYAIINPAQQKELYCGSMVINFYNSFAEFWKEHMEWDEDRDPVVLKAVEI